jgi:hypothetical protein
MAIDDGVGDGFGDWLLVEGLSKQFVSWVVGAQGDAAVAASCFGKVELSGHLEPGSTRGSSLLLAPFFVDRFGLFFGHIAFNCRALEFKGFGETGLAK